LVDCREAGFEDYFVKPVVLEELLEAAEHACKKVERWKRR
jgi:DNA-binding response OmpR family regulator